ncbi:hypothetical protein [Listeria rocourtiae]|uniref:hypothetical protein n=1 Tax=Listeria rocourtiae TaxID=647910 RepID=UPI003D2F695C
MKKFLIILGVVIIVVGGALIYLNYMNYWPFQGDKIAGVPDGEIKNINADTVDVKTDPQSLLLAASGTVDYNVKAESVNVYFDVFKRDKRVIHELITMTGSDGETDLNGHLLWAIPGFEVFKPTEIRAKIEHGGAISQDNYIIPKGIFGMEAASTAQTQPFDDGKIEKGKQYMLQTWLFNKEPMESNDQDFSKEALRDREQTAILYIVFK